jgi:glutamate---cysteine ligase / carboxylate-amine ligase
MRSRIGGQIPAVPLRRNPTLRAEDLRRVFDVPSPPTLGLEEEVMLLDPSSLDLLPRAADVLARVSGDEAIKGEMPASQLELFTAPSSTVGEATAALRAARRRLAVAASGIGTLAAAGVHPFAAVEGELSQSVRSTRMLEVYGRIARLQLVFGLHVHVAMRPATRALAVYNALRSYLPELAAMAVNSPFLGGTDTLLQSVRPKLSETLPRQGVPPPFASISELADALHWGTRAGVLADARQWWWELRLHPVLGTVEVRVCDAQSTVGASGALAAVIQSLAVWLAERHEGGDLPPADPTWRIEENRWSACRWGVHGRMADLRTGAVVPTAERLAALLDDLASTADRLACSPELKAAHALIEEPAADRHRAIAAERGLRGLVAWLTEQFLR